ncbi:MAG: PSD1 and planctomycete cytochrome C domain-containing protein [Rubripirellula sp.]
MTALKQIDRHIGDRNPSELSVYNRMSCQPVTPPRIPLPKLKAVNLFATSRFTVLIFAFQIVMALSLRADDELQYNRDIRPILSDKCFACHGPDDEERQADLRLDVREDAIRSGAIEPENAGESLLMERITSSDPDEIMPPPSSGTLSEADRETLRRWIDAGGEYQRHWAYEPIQSVAPPDVKDSNWCRNPIDRFVMRKLEDAGVAPSDEADRRTLIRRLYLDLIGLLPTPKQVEAFLHDDSPNAYESLVDALLRSDHYGERWGRHWLDQARYADSNGYTFDNARTMWPYRDWVVRAINDDMPFDQFTLEQLAGDLLPKPTLSQLTATGFHRNTLINEEGGTDDEQFRVESVIDRTNTTGTVWLALTVGCAQCHNHKFDPISQEDYYGLFAFFNSTQDKNNRGPEVSIEDPNADDIREIETRLAKLRDAKANEEKPAAKIEMNWRTLEPVNALADSGASFETLEDNSLLVSGENSLEDTYHIDFAVSPQMIASVRLAVLPHPSLPRGGPGRASNGNFVLVDVSLRDGKDNELPLQSIATADYSQPGHDVSRAVDRDLKTGWAINTNQKGNVEHWANFVLQDSVSFETPAQLRLTLRSRQGSKPYNVGRFKLLCSSETPPETDRHAALIESLVDEKKRLEAKRVKSMVMREMESPRDTHLLVRGDFLRPGKRVMPSTLAQLHPPLAESHSGNRLDLARWIVDTANPLTPRVVVNRTWQKYFGHGIVETVEDFGAQGSPPSHPELLDWLANEFVSGGWSRKQLHRQIVTSAVYRQASVTRKELVSVDSLNRLLGRQNRLRVDAEIVRDLALSASGKLTTKVGGPSVYPPQPEGVYAFTQKKKAWPTSVGEDRYRRTMYTFFYRSSPHPMLTTFDTPRFNVTCTRRSRSNTPLQSLMVANDPGMFELAEALADRVLEERDDDESRLRHAMELCLCRPPEKNEAEFLLSFLQNQQSTNATNDQDNDRYAWTAVARVLMNLDEFITRE